MSFGFFYSIFHTFTSKHFPLALRCPFRDFITIQSRALSVLGGAVRDPQLKELTDALYYRKRRKVILKISTREMEYIFLDWINKSAKLKVLSRREISSFVLIAHNIGFCWNYETTKLHSSEHGGFTVPGSIWSVSWIQLSSPCGWHTILLVCTELNPWVQSCITKATIFFLHQSQETYAWPDGNFFWSLNYSYEDLQRFKIQSLYFIAEFNLLKRGLTDVYLCHHQCEHRFILGGFLQAKLSYHKWEIWSF